MMGSRLQRERDVLSGLRRFVNPEDELEGFSACPAIRFRLCLAPEHCKDISVVALMSVPIDVRRIARHSANSLVIGVSIRKFPMLDLVHRGAANFRGAFFPEERDRAFHVP